MSSDEAFEESDQTNAGCGEIDETQLTCDALCSLSSTLISNSMSPEMANGICAARKRKNGKESDHTCSKQLQLPMFLTKTYHMIDRCDSEVAAWSESGDNFVVKNVEKFASAVLPLYFKHSNFSSFARQLNFYGFRKLRSDPILTSEEDADTSSFVRFYHEKFQRDKPDLLHEIKRATKTDQQSSKDDVDQLKMEVTKLRDDLAAATNEYNRKITELSYECNRRITSMNAEFDKLMILVQRTIGVMITPASSSSTTAAVLQHASSSANQPAPSPQADLLYSLSQAAMLQSHLRAPSDACLNGNRVKDEVSYSEANNKRFKG